MRFTCVGDVPFMCGCWAVDSCRYGHFLSSHYYTGLVRKKGAKILKKIRERGGGKGGRRGGWRERERQTGRQADRQPASQTDIQIDR